METDPKRDDPPTKDGALTEEEIREGDSLADGEVDPSDELPGDDEAA